VLIACAPGDAPKPDLPASVSPGWTLKKMESGSPERLPQTGPPPVCWKADYAGDGNASVWVCGYRSSGTAFETAQHMPSAAQQVNFQKGLYLVIVHWNNVSQTAITTLIRAIQRSLPDR
jgi:hypothetical protein